MKKTGRKKPKPRKDESIRVRLTKDQKDTLQQAADKKGLDISSWVRMVALKAAESED